MCTPILVPQGFRLKSIPQRFRVRKAKQMAMNIHSEMTAVLRFDDVAAAAQRSALIDAAGEGRRSAAVPGEILVAGEGRARAAEILTGRGFERVAEAGSVMLFRGVPADVEPTCAELRDLGLTAAPNHLIVAGARTGPASASRSWTAVPAIRRAGSCPARPDTARSSPGSSGSSPRPVRSP